MVKTWTTQHGEVIPIKEMTDSHLVNTIRYLNKMKFATREIVVGDTSDPDSFDVDVTYLGLWKDQPVYKALVKEAKKRGLYL